jgi:hypothetical protein
MSAALLIALLNASPAILKAVGAVLDDIKASGHPANAPLTAAHIAAVADAMHGPAAPENPLGNPDGAE